MAEEKKETPMLDPIAYRSDYNPNDIDPEYRNDPNLPWVWPLNANENYQEYWDDSNPAWQGQKGWLNPKYEWEGVLNTYIDYNPNLRTWDLDPNYLFWENARQQNAKEKWYIARRNDMIASALYNEWKVTRENVAEFLASQNEWMNSTEADRANTIESIYKRLWQIKPKEDEPKKEVDTSEMEKDLQQEGWKIYWKDTAEGWDPTKWINTLVDVNSVFESMNAGRIKSYESISWMNTQALAYLINDWVNPYWDQTMRDLQKYNPEKWQELQQEIKKLQWQDIVNQISEWWTIDVNDQLNKSVSNVNTSMNNFVNSTASGSSAGQLSTNLNNALAESEIVSGAREQMEVYKRKIVDIQQSIDELPWLANSYFKWDVPQYMVNAFINNRMQKYQSEIEKYQNLYNASLDEAKLEISQEQFNQEMNYKWASLQADQNYKNANLALSKQELAYKMANSSVSNWKWNDDWSYSYVDLNWEMHTLSAEEAKKMLNQELYDKSTAYIDYWKKMIDDAKANWTKVKWWQCEAMTDNFTRQNFWTEMRKEDWSKWATTVNEKARYATEALPQRGYIAVFDYWIKDANWTNRWHTGIVIDYDPVTGDFTTLESNADSEEHMEIRTRNINSVNLLWFRDPTVAEPRNDKWKNALNPTWDYYNYPNWMLEVFNDAEKYAKEIWWVNMVNDVQKGARAYWILNNMYRNWEIDAIINDEDIAWAYNEITKFINSERFLQNAYTNNMVDEDHNFILDTVLQYMMNSWDYWITPEKKQAIDDLVWLVQIKLRWDSWAAINPSEWNTDFGRYLPQIWMSPKQKLERVRNLEVDAASSQLPIEYQAKYVPIITKEMIDAQSDEVKRNTAIDILKNNRK